MMKKECDLYLEAIQNYLKSEEWKQSIEIFIQANCLHFRCQGEFSHSQYELWKEIADQVLNVAIENIGGNMMSLELAINEIVNTPVRGPRDAASKEILRQLLSFHSFEEFCIVMHQAAVNKESCDTFQNTTRYSNATRSPSRYRGDLLNLGFERDLVDLLLDNADEDSTLEQLVMQLSSMEDHSSSRSIKNDSFVSPAKNGVVKDISSIPTSPNNFSVLEALKVFLRQGDIDEDPMEFHTKFAMAKSLVDIIAEETAQAEKNPVRNNPDQLEVLQWASEMMDLYEDIVDYCEEYTVSNKKWVTLEFGMGKNRYGKPLFVAYRDLESHRKQMEKDGITGGLLSENEMRRMRELDEIASKGSLDEQHLHSLLTRYQSLQQEINILHQKLNLLVASHRTINREKLEELYLYLKEKVNSGVDLESILDELHEHVYSVLGSNGQTNTEVLNILLDMHVLEDEQYMLRREIDSLLGISVSSSSSSALSGVNAQDSWADAKDSYYADYSGTNNSYTNDGYTNDGYTNNGYTNDGYTNNGYTNNGYTNNGYTNNGYTNNGYTNDGYNYAGYNYDYNNSNTNEYEQYPENSYQNTTGLSTDCSGEYSSYPGNNSSLGYDYGYENVQASSPDQYEAYGAESLSQNDGSTSENQGYPNSSDNSFIKNEFNSESKSSSNKESLSDAKKSSMSSVSANGEMLDDVLNSLKNAHRNNLQALKDRLASEKQRHLQNLNDRLMKRRLRQDSSVNLGGDSLSEDERQKLIDNSIKEVERDIGRVKGQFEDLEAGLIDGFKKRSILEVKKTKQKGSSLTSDELHDCYLDAAQAMKDRHAKEQKKLLESLEVERQKQKNRILQNLLERKKKLQSNSTNSNPMVQQIELERLLEAGWRDLQRVDLNFDHQAKEALQKPESELMMALAGIFIEDATLKAMTANDTKISVDDEDDDDYFDDDQAKKKKPLSQRSDDTDGVSQWIDGMFELKSSYLAARNSLEQKLVDLTKEQQFDGDLPVEMGVNYALVGSDRVGSQLLMKELENIDGVPTLERTLDDNLNQSMSLHLKNVLTDAFLHQLVESQQEASSQNSSSDYFVRKFKVLNDSDRIKAEILEEFEKSKGKYEDTLEKNRQRCQDRLAERRRKASSQAEAKNFPSSEDSKEDSNNELLYLKRSQGALEALVDSFLDDPISIGPTKPIPAASYSSWSLNAYNTPLPAIQGGKKVSLAPLNTPSKNELIKKKNKLDKVSEGEILREDSKSVSLVDSRKEEQLVKDRMKLEYVEKEKDLVDGLYSQMVLKKHMLEERLRKKREDRERLRTSLESSSNKAQAEASMAVVDSMDIEADSDKGVNEVQEIRRLEQAFENVVKLVKSSDDKKLDQLNLDVVLNAMEKLSQGIPISLERIGDSSYGSGNDKTSSSDDTRTFIREEAKRIATEYNEEREKFELMMKMQQTRQRQNLQRKLLERKQQQQQTQGSISSNQDRSLNSPSSISAKEPSSSLLSADISISSSHALMKQFSTRGLNLGPMMRK